MKQSSVEWLIKQAENLMPPDVPNAWVKIKEQAKAMHKEEMVDFGNDLIAQNDSSYIGIPNLAEQYYKETYGKSEQ